MTNLFFFPQKITEKIFSKENFFLDQYGFYHIKNDKKKYLYQDKIDFENKGVFKMNPPDQIIKEISNWGPVWSRFLDQGYNYELVKRNMMIKFYQIASFCKKNKIKKVVMSTYSSHNLNSLLMDLVCEKMAIKQLFFFNSMEVLYNNENKLLVIIQKNFKNRKFLQKKVSKHSFKNFLVNKNKEIKKEINNEKFYYKSFWYQNFLHRFYLSSLFLVFIYYFYENLRKKILNKKKFFDFMNFSALSHLKILIQQKKGINFYKKKIYLVEKYKKKKHIIIAAHYQPEATSFPIGQEWNNHIDIIFELRRKGYNKKILYKEHPLSFDYFDSSTKHYRIGVSRSKDYYSNLLKLGCEFLDHKVNSFSHEFLNNFVPVTISGTIAIERSLAGYKTIYFGYPWWRNLPGTISINNIKNLKNINQFLGYNKNIEKNSIKFLCKLLDGKGINNYIGMHNLHNNKGSFSEYKKYIKKIIN